MRHLTTLCTRFRREQQGQTLVLMAAMITALLCMAGLAVDTARALYTYHEMQATTDAAALAGADMLPATSATSTATLYSAVAGNKNVNANLSGVTMVAGYPKIECLKTLTASGESCEAPANGNAVSVRETVTLPMYFMKLLGKSSIAITTTSTASMRGSKPAPLNIAIVMDTTLSMNIYDSDCGNTQEACALNAVQVLLQSLSPCSATLTTCTITNGVAANSVDRVSIFTFPSMDPSTISIDTSCTTPMPQTNSYYYLSPYGYFSVPGYTPQFSGLPTSTTYSYPTAGASSYTPASGSTYQATAFLSDYKTSDSATTLNPSSTLVKAMGGVSNCGGMQPPNYDILYETYYAPAIYAAQSALIAQQAANPGSQNVIIFLSDGDANAPQNFSQSGVNFPVFNSPATSNGSYPSWVNECAQGVTAAQAAAKAGTIVYSVAYGSPTTGCSTDTTTAITPCQAMAAIASSPSYFFPDYNQSNSQGSGTCISSSQPVTSLSAIFSQIATQLTHGRLIPDNTP